MGCGASKHMVADTTIVSTEPKKTPMEAKINAIPTVNIVADSAASIGEPSKLPVNDVKEISNDNQGDQTDIKVPDAEKVLKTPEEDIALTDVPNLHQTPGKEKNNLVDESELKNEHIQAISLPYYQIKTPDVHTCAIENLKDSLFDPSMPLDISPDSKFTFDFGLPTLISSITTTPLTKGTLIVSSYRDGKYIRNAHIPLVPEVLHYRLPGNCASRYFEIKSNENIKVLGIKFFGTRVPIPAPKVEIKKTESGKHVVHWNCHRNVDYVVVLTNFDEMVGFKLENRMKGHIEVDSPSVHILAVADSEVGVIASVGSKGDSSLDISPLTLQPFELTYPSIKGDLQVDYYDFGLPTLISRIAFIAQEHETAVEVSCAHTNDGIWKTLEVIVPGGENSIRFLPDSTGTTSLACGVGRFWKVSGANINIESVEFFGMKLPPPAPKDVIATVLDSSITKIQFKYPYHAKKFVVFGEVNGVIMAAETIKASDDVEIEISGTLHKVQVVAQREIQFDAVGILEIGIPSL